MSVQWTEEYQRKLISANAAAGLVKSGDLVSFTMGREAAAIGVAIAARRGELRDVEVFVPFPRTDFGWFEPESKGSFTISVDMPTPLCQAALDEGTCNLVLDVLFPASGLADTRKPDVLVTEVSPPDDRGFCSFGASLWDKKDQIANSRLTIAEVNPNLIRTFGDNFIHISDIDYFVEHVSTGGVPGKGSLQGRPPRGPEPYLKDLIGYVSQLVKDRDTIQIGVGRTTEQLVPLGLFSGKYDLGYHSEATPRGIISLVRDGVISNKYKSINRGKVVVTSLGGGTREELEWADNNPLFWLVNVRYLEDIRVIAKHDNMVAINSALSVDLTGQINAESIGSRIVSGPGGQIVFVIGALLSKGGRAITVMSSTTSNGTVSRIVPALPAGAGVTIHRTCADLVVTEYGVARLRGKNLKQRANELIAIAHPDFRSELRKQMQKAS